MRRISITTLKAAVAPEVHFKCFGLELPLLDHIRGTRSDRRHTLTTFVEMMSQQIVRDIRNEIR